MLLSCNLKEDYNFFKAKSIGDGIAKLKHCYFADEGVINSTAMKTNEDSL